MLVVLILAVGIVGAVVALKSHESNAELVLQQQGLAPVGPEALDALLLTTRDSRPGYSGRARAARCTSPSHSALRNPWTCLVRYPRPPSVRYRALADPRPRTRATRRDGRDRLPVRGELVAVEGRQDPAADRPARARPPRPLTPATPAATPALTLGTPRLGALTALTLGTLTLGTLTLVTLTPAALRLG
jgi:hypothetical protein